MVIMSVSETSVVPADPSGPGSAGPGGEPGLSGTEGSGAEGTGRARPELPADRYLDREQSWVQFNQRVLELAEDDQVPLLERVRFLAIFASNLDEFFMVRVAGLMRRMAAGFPVENAV